MPVSHLTYSSSRYPLFAAPLRDICRRRIRRNGHPLCPLCRQRPVSPGPPFGVGRRTHSILYPPVQKFRRRVRGYGRCDRHSAQGKHMRTVDRDRSFPLPPVFVCVAALAILDRLDKIEHPTLCWWLSERQLPSGGLNGRLEKLEDVGYPSSSDV